MEYSAELSMVCYTTWAGSERMPFGCISKALSSSNVAPHVGAEAIAASIDSR